MIDTQSIRSKILDLAMCGQLTVQLPEDGNAEELYQQILMRKAELIKAGKIRKDKELKQNSHSNRAPILPENWKWINFGSIITLQSGADLKPEEYTSTNIGVPYLTGASNFDDNGHLIINRWTEHPKNIAIKDDVLLSCKGTVGKLAILEIERVHIARQFMAIRAYEVNIKFVQFFMQSIIENIKKAQKGLIPGIERNDIIGLNFPLPPLAEQKRIVEKIEQTFSVLDIIDELQAKYADNLTVLKSKLIDLAIQGKLTEQLPEDGTAEELYQQIQAEKQTLIKAGKIKKEKPSLEITDDEIPFEVPDNWEWVRIGTIGMTVTGGTPSKAHPEYYGGDYPFFKPSDLAAGRHIIKASEYLSESGKAVARQFQKGTILVCCIGSIGKCAITDNDGTANQQINALTPILCDSDYLLYAIGSNSFNYQLNQGARATTVSIISKSKFDSCIIPLPPLSEQKRIVDRLDQILAVCDEMK